MRPGAFVTHPLVAVDIQGREIRQWPSLGVRTKFHKQLTTYLFEIPDLIEVISNWDQLIRQKLAGDSLWFAPLDCHSRDLDPKPHGVRKHRTTRLRKDLRRWLHSVDLPYYSPKAFRHGNALYGRLHARNAADYMSVSRNLGHSSVSTTDSIYGRFGSEERKRRILSLGNSHETESIRRSSWMSFPHITKAMLSAPKERNRPKIRRYQSMNLETTTAPNTNHDPP